MFLCTPCHTEGCGSPICMLLPSFGRCEHCGTSGTCADCHNYDFRPKKNDERSEPVPASNTKECLQELVGSTVIGVLIGALPVGQADLAKGTHSLVLDDGRAITFNSNGAFWIDSAEDVRRALDRTRKALEDAMGTYERVLEMAGSPRRPSTSTTNKEKRDG